MGVFTSAVSANTIINILHNTASECFPHDVHLWLCTGMQTNSKNVTGGGGQLDGLNSAVKKSVLRTLTKCFPVFFSTSKFVTKLLHTYSPPPGRRCPTMQYFLCVWACVCGVGEGVVMHPYPPTYGSPFESDGRFLSPNCLPDFPDRGKYLDPADCGCFPVAIISSKVLPTKKAEFNFTPVSHLK